MDHWCKISSIIFIFCFVFSYCQSENNLLKAFERTTEKDNFNSPKKDKETKQDIAFLEESSKKPSLTSEKEIEEPREKKTIRKENGAVYIIQDPSQLPQNEYTEGIIANSQVLIVLPSKKLTYLKIQETFKLEPYELEMMQTLKNNTEEGAKYKYTEQWMKLGEQSMVTRLELSKEAFLAFQTDGVVWSKLNNLKNETGNLQKAIEMTLKS